MRFIFHGFFSTKRWHKYFFNLTARSKRRQLIIEISWDFSKIQKWSLFFLIFSALYDDTNIFSIWRQDQSAAISKFKFWKILNRPYNGVYFSWFFSTMQTQFFSVLTAGSKCRRHKIWFRKILIRHKIQVYFSWLFRTIIEQIFFKIFGTIKVPPSKTFKICILRLWKNNLLASAF